MRRLAAAVFVAGLLVFPFAAFAPTAAADGGGVAPDWISIPAIGVEAAI